MQRAAVVVLRGWKAIQQCMFELSGVERSRITLWRYARRRLDPLPVRTTFSRDRVCASAHELSEWLFRHRFTY